MALHYPCMPKWVTYDGPGLPLGNSKPPINCFYVVLVIVTAIESNTGVFSIRFFSLSFKACTFPRGSGCRASCIWNLMSWSWLETPAGSKRVQNCLWECVGYFCKSFQHRLFRKALVHSVRVSMKTNRHLNYILPICVRVVTMSEAHTMQALGTQEKRWLYVSPDLVQPSIIELLFKHPLNTWGT